MKRSLAIVLALVMCLSLVPMTVFAAGGITVTLDGEVLAFDVPPQLINNRTMVPLRVIFEAMGASVEWDGSTKTVTGTKGGTVVVLTIGSTSPTINGQVVTIDQPGVIIDNRTLAPLRFVAEAFGGTVVWDGNSQIAAITSGSTAATPTPKEKPEPTTTSNNKLVGRWYLEMEYPHTERAVVFFDTDGTYFLAMYVEADGIRLYKGEYQVDAEQLYLTNGHYYTSFVTSDVSVLLDIWRIIREGSREEVLSLFVTPHPYYDREIKTEDWDTTTDREAVFEFPDGADKLRIMGLFTMTWREYLKVND